MRSAGPSVSATAPRAGVRLFALALGLGVATVTLLVAHGRPVARAAGAGAPGGGGAPARLRGFGPSSAGQPGRTFTVDDPADAPDADPGDGRCATPAGACSLRGAVMESNALPGADTVLLPAGTYVLDQAGNGPAAGDLDVTDHMTLRGAGPGTRIVASVPGQRVLQVAAGDSAGEPAVVVADLALQGGDSTVGGGIHAAAGTLRLVRIEVVDNKADVGGGIMVSDAARLELWASTVAGNLARQGGGVFVAVPLNSTGGITSNLVNSTVSGNVAEVGGGLAAAGQVRLSSTTVTGNTAAQGAGAFASGLLALDNTAVASNRGGADCATAGGRMTSLGHNADGDGTCGLDRALGDLAAVDPGLAPLAWMGGPTRTHLPGADSPLLDAGGGCPATDQRGVPRPQGKACDIGAVERETAALTVTPTPGATASATPGATATPSSPATATATPSPRAPASPSPSATATASPSPSATATASPSPSATASPSPSATATASPSPEATASRAPVCPQIAGRVPDSAVAAALADPAGVAGWGLACNPNVPVSPYNPLRSWLTLRNPAQAYHPVFNGLTFKCGCP